MKQLFILFSKVSFSLHYLVLTGTILLFYIPTLASSSMSNVPCNIKASSIYKQSPLPVYNHILSYPTAPAPTYFYTDDIIEIAKIMVMNTVGAVIYGVTHDLITTQINIDYFASDRTHHGPVTRKSFPFIYQSNNKILYALLWGTISTWWVGLPIGILWGIAARSNSEQLGWRDLIKPMLVFSSGMLTASVICGLVSYASHKDSFKMVAIMHEASYITGIVGGILMAGYIYCKERGNSNNSSIVQIETNGISINLISLFKK
jgi:hypothetical protein